MGKYFYGLSVGDFKNQMQNILTRKDKINILDYIKNENFCSL